jgi:hypothetical protein
MRKASKKAVKIKIGLAGTAGSGKTYSALQLAYGLCGDWNKICVIDAENGSAELYEELGEYWVIPLNNFSPEAYIAAIQSCVKNGIEVVIIDGITPEWEWCLQYHSNLGGKYQDWAKVTPLHNQFKNAILQAPVHIISTVRKKQEHTMVTGESGKATVQKLGLADVTRNDWEYEVTLNFNIAQSNLADASKDRTGLFKEEMPFVITQETGKAIKDWCESGTNDAETDFNNAKVEINNSMSRDELTFVYNKYSNLKENPEFIDSLKQKQATLGS